MKTLISLFPVEVHMQLFPQLFLTCSLIFVNLNSSRAHFLSLCQRRWTHQKNQEHWKNWESVRKDHPKPCISLASVIHQARKWTNEFNIQNKPPLFINPLEIILPTFYVLHVWIKTQWRKWRKRRAGDFGSNMETTGVSGSQKSTGGFIRDSGTDTVAWTPSQGQEKQCPGWRAQKNAGCNLQSWNPAAAHSSLGPAMSYRSLCSPRKLQHQAGAMQELPYSSGTTSSCLFPRPLFRLTTVWHCPSRGHTLPESSAEAFSPY